MNQVRAYTRARVLSSVPRAVCCCGRRFAVICSLPYISLFIRMDLLAGVCTHCKHTHTHTITITHKTHQSTGFGTLTLPLQHHHAGHTITQAHNKFLQYKTLRCTKYPFKHTLHLINAHPHTHTHTHTLITIFSKNKTYRFDGWIGYFDIFK